jgi:hypothetical protein
MRIFRRKTDAAPNIPSSGHDGDDQLLAQIAQHSNLETGRHWVHYVYFADERAAREAAEQISNGGWLIQRVDSSAAGGPEWVVIAERHNAVTTPESVRAAREFFEAVATAHPGGEYDGWEASL